MTLSRRRWLLLGVAGIALRSRAEAQPSARLVRIGVLIPSSRSLFMARFTAFQDAFRDLGYVEGKTVAYEYQYGDGQPERLEAASAALVRSQVALIFTASAEGVLAAKRATRTIPIVFGTVQDALAEGIVETLARPGANATGLSALAPELTSKRLSLLKELAPDALRVAFLWASRGFGAADRLKEMKTAASALGLQVQPLEVRALQDLEGALQAALKGQAQALTTAPDPLINGSRGQIVAFAAKNRLPAVYGGPEFAEGGGLMSYSPDYADLWRRAAGYAHRILKGARPADLPVEQPSKFFLTVNLKAARQIGLTVIPSVLVRADKVIE